MFKFKKVISTLSFILLLILLVSCNNKTKEADIVTTLYPQYDIAKQIAGEKLSVSLLTPLGTEVHGYEPTARDIVSIKNAKLFLYTSDTLERWAKNTIKNEVNFINLSKAYTLVPYENSNLKDDLHYWIDPTTFVQLINVIRDAIIEIDPANQTYFEENAVNYFNKINSVHEELVAFTNTKKDESIFFYGHNALASFGARYNIKIVSLSLNYQPDAELSPGQITDLKEKIKKANSKYLFVEELIDRKAVNSLVKSLKNEGHTVELLELHGFHNITKTQYKKGITYFDLLRQNLENLKKALS